MVTFAGLLFLGLNPTSQGGGLAVAGRFGRDRQRLIHGNLGIFYSKRHHQVLRGSFFFRVSQLCRFGRRVEQVSEEALYCGGAAAQRFQSRCELLMIQSFSPPRWRLPGIVLNWVHD
jgi:hypothetical protein